MDFKYSKLQKILSIVSWGLGISGIFYLILFWRNIPNTLPMHWTGGNIDRYGDKTELIPIILIFILIYFVIIVISFFPGDYNDPPDIKEEYGDIINDNNKTKWLIIRIEYMILVSCLIRNIIQAKGLENVIGIFIFLFTGTFIFYDLRLSKYK